MEKETALKVLEDYNFKADECSVQAFGTGLINRTWRISSPQGEYILQLINTKVFRHPQLIADNVNALSNYLEKHSPDYLFTHLIPTREGKSLAFEPSKGYFRLWPFVPESYNYDVVQASQLAYEAARQFGKFTRLLSGFPIKQLHFTLPDFHNLSLRYELFEQAVTGSSEILIRGASEQIRLIRSFSSIVEQFEHIKHNLGFRIRPTHHDTKISNVLFDKNGHGLCVIDLDTVMPGYFISDLGDMIRTYISPVSEEEQDFSQITVRDEYFDAIVRGFLSEMKEELSDMEIEAIVYAGKFMIYMQAIRFLTDHLNRDRYYGAKYEGHNLVRAGNQITLLQRLIEKENPFKDIVSEISACLILK